MSRVRALFAIPLLALAAFHLQPAQGLTLPPPQAPEASQVAAWAPSGPSSAQLLVAALTKAQAQHEADVALWVANAPKPKTARRAPSTAPQAAPAEPVAYDAGSIEAVICSVFGDSCPKAIRIATCESGLNPSARNRSGASGLFQLLGHGDLFEAHGWSADDWPDPWKNAMVAFDLSSGGTNWRAWVCK